MTTPNILLTRPDAPATLAPLLAHQVALLIRGLDRHLTLYQKLHALGVGNAEWFHERHDPAARIRAGLAAALADWCERTGWGRRTDDDGLDVAWPAGPALVPSALTVAELWELRLAVDYTFMDVDDEDKASGRDPAASSYDRFEPLRTLAGTLLSALTASGFDPDDVY